MDLVSSKIGIFGLPFSYSQARVILIPVPWDVTTSYGKGTSQGPQAIRQASEQVDLYDFETGNVFEAGIHMLPLPLHLRDLNRTHRVKAEKAMKLLARGKTSASEKKSLKKWQMEVNQASEKMNAWVEAQTRKVLKDGKIPGLVGGDHSSPFGCIKAVLAEHPDAGILHVDAHADLRVAYQGFEFSHASIMWNVVSKLGVKNLVQVGIRDFCEEEKIFAQENSVQSFYDFHNKKRLLEGDSWKDIVAEIVHYLPHKIYVSFDIDGLDPALCPSTGTPVPGGLSWQEAQFLLSSCVSAGKKIVGFDLNEVAPGKTEWDANVGARLLYRLSCLSLKSQGLNS